MAVPPNDLFANAITIWDGTQLVGFTSDASLEPGEATTTPGWQNVTIGQASVWYRWIADFTTTVQFSLDDSNSQHYIDAFQGDTFFPDDTITSVTRIGTDGSRKSIQFTAIAGITYYLRVGQSAMYYPGNFALTYPIGRDPGSLSSPGVNDLPSLAGSVRTTALVEILEAIGAAPDSELTVVDFTLVSDDRHSTDAQASSSMLDRNSDGTPAYTCERWIRLRISPPFGAIVNPRFWVDNYQPNSGWELLWGTADTYRKPTLDRSDIAVLPVATTDPIVGNLGLELISGGGVRYSPWIVIQARWTDSSPGPIQTSPLNWRFDWTES